MGLPEINVLPVHELTLPVKKEKIVYTPFTIEQEKSILMALDSDKVSDLLNNYKKILKTCCENLSFDNMSIVDFISLIINVRAKSKGETLELLMTCENCKEKSEYEVLIEDTLKYKNIDNVKDHIAINENLSLQLKPLDHNFLYGLDEIKNEMDMYEHTAAHCVSKLMYNKKIYNIDDIEELKDKVISKLSHKHLNDIFKKCKDFITIYLSIDFKCLKCGHESTIDVENFLKLLK